MPRDDILLLDMLLAAREAVEFAEGLTFETFQRDRMAQLAILKAVEIVGEAASPVGVESRNVSIPRFRGRPSWECGIASCTNIPTSTWHGCGKP